MIKNIYGDYIWKSTLDNEFIEEYKNEFNSKIIEKKTNRPVKTGSWGDCNVKSSFFNNEFVQNCLTIDFNGMFSNKILEEIQKFFLALETFDDNTNKIDIKTSANQLWSNDYNYGDFQENHCHSGTNAFYSFVYILKSTNIELDSTLAFENPRSSHFRSMIIGEIIQNDNYTAVYKPELNEGDLIIFPSHMKHYVTGHKNRNNNRISISGNICVA